MIPSPCKGNKCITYPICRNLESIDCCLLDEWYIELERISSFMDDKKYCYLTNDNAIHKKIWESVNMVLPKLKKIEGVMKLDLERKQK